MGAKRDKRPSITKQRKRVLTELRKSIKNIIIGRRGCSQRKTRSNRSEKMAVRRKKSSYLLNAQSTDSVCSMRSAPFMPSIAACTSNTERD